MLFPYSVTYYDSHWATNNHADHYMIDSGSNVHISNQKDALSSFHKRGNFVRTPSGTIKGNGSGLMSIQGSFKTVELSDVQFIPTAPYSILSFSKLSALGFVIDLNEGTFAYPDGTTLQIIRDNGLYFIDFKSSPHASKAHKATKFTANPIEAEGNDTETPDDLTAIDKIHLRLGHISQRYIDTLVNVGVKLGLEIEPQAKLRQLCIPCRVCKASRPHFSSASAPLATEPGELICSDIWGKFDTPSFGGNIYAIHFTDYYTRYSRVYFMQKKSEALDKFKLFIKEVCDPCKLKIKRLRTDNDSVYVSAEFKLFTSGAGIEQEQSSPYCHEQNGIAERYWRTVQTMAHCLLETAQLDLRYWAFAFAHAAYLKNRVPHSGIDFEIPYQRLTGRQPDLSDVRIFGCKAFAFIDPNLRKKLDPKAQELLYVGHDATSKSYLLWDLAGRTVVKSGMATFYEDSHFGRILSKSLSPLKFNDPEEARISVTDDSEDYSIEDVQDILDHGCWYQAESDIRHAVVLIKLSDDTTRWVLLSGYLSKCGDARKFANYIRGRDTSKDHPFFFRVSVRYSDRGSKPRFAPAYICSTDFNDPNGLFYQVVYTSDGSHQDVRSVDISDLPAVPFVSMNADISRVPYTYRESQTMADAAEWHEATTSEIDSMYKRAVFELATWPTGKNVLKSRMVYKIKRDGRYKARFVACGYSQKPGEDYDTTFAPVSQLTTFRLFLALSLQLGLTISQADVETAYLYSDLDEEIYIRIPEGMDDRDDDGNKMCWKLKKGLYGLKQSGFLWYRLISGWLRDFGFEQSVVDSCIYVYRNGDVTCLISTYVDDLFISCNCADFKADLIAKLREKFSITESTSFDDALGIQLDHKLDGFKLHMTNYITAMLERHGMSQCHSTALPMDPGFEIHSKDAPTTDDEKAEMEKLPYAKLIGELLWLSRCCRPDITFAVSILARFTHCYSRRHFNALKHIMKYLKGTIDYGLIYTKSDDFDVQNSLIAYTDSDYAGSKADRYSTSGGILYLANCPISWRTKKQSTIATSTTESELTAMFEMSKEIAFARNLLETLHFEQKKPTILHCDNAGAFHLSKNPAVHDRSKHFEIRVLKVREYVSREYVFPNLIRTSEMIADIFTKALTKGLFERFRTSLFSLSA